MKRLLIDQELFSVQKFDNSLIEITETLDIEDNKNDIDEASTEIETTIEEKLSFATEKEKEAYYYRQKGNTYKKIAEIMDISVSRVGQLVNHAERRIREYNRFIEAQKGEKEKFSQVIDFEMTYGDGKFITDTLLKSIKSCENDNGIRYDSTVKYREANKSKLPYNYFLMRELHE